MKPALDPRRLLARLGLPGLLGLALLGFAAWVGWVDAPRRQAAIADLQAETARLRSTKPGELPREERPQALLAALYGRLQTPDQRSAALSGLLNRAKELGLSVESVQFRAQAERGSGLVRHEVQLPLKGSYPALRDWIARSLQDQPALSLDAVQIRREQALADPIEARVKATLWVRNEPRTVVSRAQPAPGNRLLAQPPAPTTLAAPNAAPRVDYVVQPRAPGSPRATAGKPAPQAAAKPPAPGPLSKVAAVKQPAPPAFPALPADAPPAAPLPPGVLALRPDAGSGGGGGAAPGPAVAAASAPSWPPSNLPPGMALRAPPYTPAFASMPGQGRPSLPR